MGSSGGIRATVPGAFVAAGNVTGAGFITGAGLGQLTEGVGGSALTLMQCSGILSAPAAQRARVYLRAGTTGLKLVALGNGGTEFTILDNII